VLARFLKLSVSFKGMFAYKFLMSSDAKVKCGGYGVFLKFWISSLVFLTLKAFGNRAMWLILFVNSLEAGVWCQFTMGRIGWSGLCIFTSPLMVGAEGFKLMYFHLLSCGIRVLLSF
jgi:hypothetical protein